MKNQNKKMLFLMCGPSGSGKSTWIKDHLTKFEGYTKVVSRDSIRFSIITDKDEYFSKEKEVYNKFIEEIKDGLKYCDITIADATHLSQGSRTKLLRALGPALKDIEVNAIALKVPMDVAIARNNQRTGREHVPEEVIKSMYKDYTTPTIEEGFDNVWQAIYNGENKYTYAIEMSDIEKFYAESEV